MFHFFPFYMSKVELILLTPKYPLRDSCFVVWFKSILNFQPPYNVNGFPTVVIQLLYYLY